MVIIQSEDSNLHSDNFYKLKGKDKQVSVQVWTGSEGSRRIRFPDLKTTEHEGGKIVSHTHRPPLLPQNIASTYFC
jgi:hypothetical protein